MSEHEQQLRAAFERLAPQVKHRGFEAAMNNEPLRHALEAMARNRRNKGDLCAKK